MELYRDMDVILCPSLDDPMPIVCTEAMIFGKPVIVSDHTGTASFITEGVTGYVVPAGDARALAKAIVKAVADKDKLPDMGRAARRIYDDHFTMQVFASHVKEIIVA